MGIYKIFWLDVKKKPALFGYMGALILVLCLLEYYFIYPLIQGIGIFGGSLPEGMTAFIVFFLAQITNIKVLLAFTVISLLLSLVLAFWVMCCLRIFQSIHEKLKPDSGQGVSGSKALIVSLIWRIFTLSLITAAFKGFLLVSAVPSLVVIRAVLSGKKELLAAAAALGLLTALVLLFLSLTYQMYVSFWICASCYCRQKAFTTAKKLVDRHFGSILENMLLLSLLFAAAEAASMYFLGLKTVTMPSGLFIFLLIWLFKSILGTWYFSYIYTAYGHYSSINISGNPGVKYSFNVQNNVSQ